MTALVQMADIRRTFPGTPPIHAVADVGLEIAHGEYVSIVGPSGSGKSTLLSLIGCLDTPTSGTYHLGGVDVGGLSDGRRAGLRGSEIGFVFQAFHLLPHRTVLENVAMGMLYNRSARRLRRKRAEHAIDQVGLSHRSTFLPTKLSGGERQRVAIARAIAAGPSVLLCDEPTGNLDTATTSSILDLFDGLRAMGLTIVVVTHEDVVSSRADRRIALEDGVIADQT